MKKHTCKDCKNRFPACHDTCEEYKKNKEENEKIKEQRRKYSIQNEIIIENVIRCRERVRKRK